jgi:serine 3-dehydrogenase
MTTKTAWITGATSGFGAATVERFVAGGWRVIASGRRVDRLQQLVDRHGAEHVHAAAFDVRDEAAMRAAHAALPPAFAGIDLLVNNAGLALGAAPAQQADLAQWKQMMRW